MYMLHVTGMFASHDVCMDPCRVHANMPVTCNILGGSQCPAQCSYIVAFLFIGFTLGIILGVGVAQGNISTLKPTQW